MNRVNNEVGKMNGDSKNDKTVTVGKVMKGGLWL